VLFPLSNALGGNIYHVKAKFHEHLCQLKFLLSLWTCLDRTLSILVILAHPNVLNLNIPCSVTQHRTSPHQVLYTCRRLRTCISRYIQQTFISLQSVTEPLFAATVYPQRESRSIPSKRKRGNSSEETNPASVSSESSPVIDKRAHRHPHQTSSSFQP